MPMRSYGRPRCEWNRATKYLDYKRRKSHDGFLLGFLLAIAFMAVLMMAACCGVTP